MNISITEENITGLSVDGIILGVFEDNALGTTAQSLEPQLRRILDLGDFTGKKKQVLTLYNIDEVSAPRVVLVGLGKEDEADHEEVRVAASLGARQLRENGASSIALEALAGDAQSTAEGVLLGLYVFDELKEEKDDKKEITDITFMGDETDFQRGIILAEAQNLARRLAELPSNIATPTFFVEQAIEQFAGLENVELEAYDEDWARERKMNSFLSVASGSDEPAKFLEIKYSGGEQGQAPIVYVGKGITFDTGGISLKGSSGMGMMRGDCGGAAAVIGTLLALVKLKVPVNAIGLTPLTENMPSGKATKPSDVVVASNGKSIEIDNTDAEGRLILADALVYADEFEPETVIDIATLTGSINVALGGHFLGAFTNSDELWQELERAGNETFERIWRMPVDDLYKKQLKSTLADLKNVGGRPAGSVTAAMFLKEFTTSERWAHLDIAGVAWVKSEEPYKIKGMTGMPVRALTQFAVNRSQ